MEELYTVHDQFWSWTLWPCLEQVPHLVYYNRHAILHHALTIYGVIMYSPYHIWTRITSYVIMYSSLLCNVNSFAVLSSVPH